MHPADRPRGGLRRRNTRKAPTRKVLAFRWLSGVAAAPVAGIALLRAVPADWPVLGVQLLAFVPWFTVPAIAAFLLSLPARSRPLQLVTAALLGLQVLWLFLPAPANPEAAHAGHPAVQVRAMAINAELGLADAERIVELVREERVDLLVIAEYTQELADRLSAAALPALLPHQVAHPQRRAGGAAIYSSLGLREVGVVPDTPFRMPVVSVDLPQAGQEASLRVVAVHALAPVEDGLEQWRNDLAALDRIDAGSGPLLLAGDFNATFDHREFRELLAGGSGRRPLVDVATAAGNRLVPTWPMRGYSLPGVTLDHLVTSPDITGSDYAVRRVAGTDHAAVLATLSIRLA
ncbi:endonuclease/exonuclease/phosphatase family protein [Pseudarthrobacter sp. NamE5]|uniref:endonuclease/exonuclease/phosphatase family protein n=1 Tax=Pseudarthrobacter sp. NamE5 TaxID=2576839 RepID=UPI00110A33B3|nr:endonuclease/exonuclease/phosphatase family protein [Pseudarthrobacter sp. NamE5]TLM87457.1 endonuclease/exonuclease/phosphatase family protein [Pseudarthrobacter sp. NamE5]